MKKLILILSLISLTVLSIAQDRTGRIATGSTTIAPALTFSAADSIVTSDSLVILVTNPQRFYQHATFTSTIDDVDGGSPSIVITLRGRVTSTDSWHPVGSAVTWTAESGNPVTITSTTPSNYNWYKVSYVASGATQHSKVLTAELKTANAYELPSSLGTLTLSRPTSGTVTLTAKDNDANAAFTVKAGGTGAFTLGQSTGTTAITGSAVNINASANIATNINTGTSTGALSLGGGSGTVAVNSSAWDVTAAGVVTGLTSVTTTKDGDNVILDPGADLHAIDIQVNSASKFSVDSVGNITAAGTLTIPGALTSGSMIVAVDTCKGAQTKNVANLGVLRVTAACTLKGLSGGVAGQLLRILNTSATTCTLKHNGTGTQKIMVSGGSDLAMSAQYNAVTMTFDGTNWYITGKGQ